MDVRLHPFYKLFKKDENFAIVVDAAADSNCQYDDEDDYWPAETAL